ncbi:MAG TPA: response regulator transcription factor [Candidatus Lustribacter sp.]|nr:response regulator transcription factor [Candidatus Lustribacter sp.]
MEARKTTILVVDDETALLDVLDAYLRDEGFAVLRAADGRTAVDIALTERPDLVLLDLNLPVLSGLEAFREIRAQLDVPVIMLTARGAEVDRVVGLELGADDYVSKPYSPREVVARVKTVLRRFTSAPETGGAPRRAVREVRRVGDLTIDLTGHEVAREGTPIKLTPTEYRLLCIFADHPGQVFTRDHLIELISSDGSEVFDRTLDRHIANLRAKIEIDPQRPRYVLTVYGAGYKLAELP